MRTAGPGRFPRASMLRRHPDGEKTGNPLALARSRQAQPEHHRCERHRHSCPRPLVRSARALAPYEPSPAPRRTPLVRAMGVLMTRLNRLLTIRQACRIHRSRPAPCAGVMQAHCQQLRLALSDGRHVEACTPCSTFPLLPPAVGHRLCAHRRRHGGHTAAGRCKALLGQGTVRYPDTAR